MLYLKWHWTHNFFCYQRKSTMEYLIFYLMLWWIWCYYTDHPQLTNRNGAGQNSSDSGVFVKYVVIDFSIVICMYLMTIILDSTISNKIIVITTLFTSWWEIVSGIAISTLRRERNCMQVNTKNLRYFNNKPHYTAFTNSN